MVVFFIFYYALKMAENKEHFRHIMLFYFRKGKNASQTQKKICAVYGEDAVDDSTCRKWFRKFRENNCNLSDTPRSGRSVEADGKEILALIESDQHRTTREIGEILGINQSTVSRRLRQLGMVNKADVWVPHELMEKNLLDRISACDSLLKRNEIDPFLKRMVTSDEKWVVYNNVSVKDHGLRARRSPFNQRKSQFTSEKDYAIHLVGLEGNHLL